MKALGIIPARYASSRFPGKPLVDIAGKPMIQRVYEQACKADLTKVVIATDDERIAEAAKAFGGEVLMTSANHPSGTDRCQEACAKVNEDFDVVVNIQGDEPFIQPGQINNLLACFEDRNTQIATLVKRVELTTDLFNPNRVKVLLNRRNDAMYFSRAPLPYRNGVEASDWLKDHAYFLHIGMYAYRPHILEEITQLAPSSLEKAEQLEQLRWLEHGYRIRTAETDIESDAIDHPDDLRRMLERYQQGDYGD